MTDTTTDLFMNPESYIPPIVLLQPYPATYIGWNEHRYLYPDLHATVSSNTFFLEFNIYQNNKLLFSIPILRERVWHLIQHSTSFVIDTISTKTKSESRFLTRWMSQDLAMDTDIRSGEPEHLVVRIDLGNAHTFIEQYKIDQP